MTELPEAVKKPPVKVLAGVAAVVLVLLVLRKRGGGSAAPADTGSGSLASDEAGLLQQLGQSNADLIAAQLGQIPAGARGPTGPPGKQGPPGKPGKPVPPGTVHHPPKHPPGGHPGVPIPHGHYVTVKKGDTLSGIAKKSKVSDWHKLLNPRTDAKIRQHPNTIHPGEKVWIPN